MKVKLFSKSFCILALITSATIFSANGAKILFDFENPKEINSWRNVRNSKLSFSSKFNASGKNSLKFSTPKWIAKENDNKHHWPAIETKPKYANWSSFEKIAFEVVNASNTSQELMFYIVDDRPFKQGLYLRKRLEPKEHTQIVVNLKEGFKAKKIDPSKIRLIHIFTEDPKSNMTLYLDRFILLKAGEKIPSLGKKFTKDYLNLQKQKRIKLLKKIEKTQEVLERQKRLLPANKWQDWAQRKLNKLEQKKSLYQLNTTANHSSITELKRSLINLPIELESFKNQFLWGLKMAKSYSKCPPALLGTTSAAEQVLPLAPQIYKVPRQIKLSLAKNEKEGCQLIIMPTEKKLEDVEIYVDSLINSQGDKLSSANISIHPIGYVKTKHIPLYGSSYIGWYPDFILNFIKKCDIPVDRAQSFFLKVKTLKNQAPGIYRGKIKIKSKKQTLFELKLIVKVFDFALSSKAPLPLAVTFWGDDFLIDGERKKQKAWRKSEKYPCNIWKKQKVQWVNFLADYYITYDSLYDHKTWNPDFKMLQMLKQEGKLNRFNLGYFRPATNNASNHYGLDATFERIAPRYQKAKELGLLPYAYFYGCDEVKADAFDQVERSAKLLKKRFPSVKTLTTTADDSFGINSVIKSIDIWSPVISKYNIKQANSARKQGKKVWWYIGSSIHHPYPNIFLEYPVIETRLLMGMMVGKYRPDGFLYYQISLWNSQYPLSGKTFTDWNPRSWSTFHGDGALTAVACDGKPVGTLRLENFRDGLEDWAYLKLLEEKIVEIKSKKGLTAKEKQILQEAQKALVIPNSIVKNLVKYTHDVKKLNAYRQKVAMLIERLNKI
jgi:Glycoside hydrolase 123, catalytic domain/Glycoside hydrolase 123 N-terminal domain